jgi:hypothetical protein
MLTIRDEQMAALGAARLDAFVRQLRDDLLVRLPQRGVLLDADQLDAEIHKGIAHARQFHITGEADVARFIALVLARWGAHPGAGYPRQLLPNLMAHGLDAGLKLDRFEAQWHDEVADHA